MNIKSVLVLGLKIVALTIVMFILNAVGDALFSAQSVAAEMSSEESANSALGLLIVCLIDTLILTYFILRSRLSGLRLMVVVALVFYGVKTFTSMLEAWYFVTNIAPEELVGMFLFTIPLVVIFPLVAVPILGKAKKRQETDDTPNMRLVMSVRQLIGKVVFLSVIVMRSFEMFASLLGTWIPFALIFTSTFVTGSSINRSSTYKPVPGKYGNE